MKDDYQEQPLSETTVTMELYKIQERFKELAEAEGDDLGLSLEEPLPLSDNTNPYNLG